jgi:hypothetical protein
MTTSLVSRTGNDLDAGNTPQGAPAEVERRVLEYQVAGEDIVGDHTGSRGLDSIELKGITRHAIHAYLHGEDACLRLVGECPIPANKSFRILPDAPKGCYELSTSDTPPSGGPLEGSSGRRRREGSNGKLDVGSDPGPLPPR